MIRNFFKRLFGKTEEPRYECHVVSRDTWIDMEVGAEYKGGKVVEGFVDRGGTVPSYVLVTKHVPEWKCPHGDHYDDCPVCRH